MDSATRRGRIVSQLSCQTRQDVFRGLNNQSQIKLEKRSLNHRITAKRFSATVFIAQADGLLTEITKVKSALMKNGKSK
ncbi:MAG: hypothetical protein WB509_07725, partial [Acetobacteraceae bacterium]